MSTIPSPPACVLCCLQRDELESAQQKLESQQQKLRDLQKESRHMVRCACIF